ncbi:MAG: ABC transporter ATP-binding protein [Planctomycetia bacterium]
MPADTSAPILSVRDLHVHFEVPGDGWRAPPKRLRAVDGVSFDLHRGETLGLVGESGCGKSTLARAILRLVAPSAGQALLDVSDDPAKPEIHDLAKASGGAMRRLRRHIQLVFQDPFASLNPRMTVGEIVAEPMRIHRLHPRGEIRDRTADLMNEVGLDPTFARRYPHEFSGGQRQRVGIARALALNPKVILCDEPVSALDVSIRSQVCNLFMELQERRGLSYLFIAHDLSVVKRISHRVAVMYLGKIVEQAPYDRIYGEALHPYTEALLSAIPIPDPVVEASRRRILLRGEVPSPTADKRGCDFAPRCPKVMNQCADVTPLLTEHRPGHWASCLLHDADQPTSG